jgi:glycerol uptake facilitator protein
VNKGKPPGWRTGTVGELVSEFLGTLIIMAFGTGSVAMAVAALPGSERTRTAFVAGGDWLLIAWGWGLGVAFAVWVAGGISGAHLNPAVTLAQALRRNFSWAKVPSYMAVQVAGGFAGAALVYLNYHDAISSFEAAQKITRGTPDSAATVGIFVTTPAAYFDSWFGPFLDQVIGTGFLVMFIFAVTDALNTPAKANLAPFVVGLIVVVIGISFGANAGYAINPARDLGPRLLAWVEGWKSVAMPGDYGNVNAFFWIPIAGPLVGGAVGAYLYDWLIRDTLVARGAVPDPDIDAEARTNVEEPTA